MAKQRLRIAQQPLVPLAQWIKAIATKDGRSISEFCRMYGLKLATFDQVCRGYYFYNPMSTKSRAEMAKVLAALSSECGKQITIAAVCEIIDRASIDEQKSA